MPHAEEPPPATPLRALLGRRNVILLILSYIAEGYVLFIFVFWLYLYLVEQRHFSAVRGGWAAALPWLTALALTPLGGRLCDLLSRRQGRLAGARTVLVTGYGVSGLMLFLAASAHAAAISVAALSLSIAFLMASEAAFWSAAAHLAGNQVGAISGIMNTAGVLGGILSTSLVPVVALHAGWLPALGSGTAMALFCVTLWLGIREENTAQ
jgi:MFS transporter, ACS family, glucarate transporter